MKDLVVLGGNRLHAGFALRKKELGIDRVRNRIFLGM